VPGTDAGCGCSVPGTILVVPGSALEGHAEVHGGCRKANVEGKVVLTIEVGADGRAHRVRVSKALGSGLDEQAVMAVRQWRFRPAIKDGMPVTVPATIEIPFRFGDTPKHSGV
jgi:protein TonB